MGGFISIKNRLFNFKFRDNALKNHLENKNISHYLFKYDLLEYDLKRIYQSFTLSYFTHSKRLNEDAVDLDELRNYESIEKLDKNHASVLIKKFKLRVSIDKNNDFSDEIIISDIYDFDLDNLSHEESLIKIAIVKDNADLWINNGKLDKYDFIFTIQEYSDYLKENNFTAYVIEDNCTYLQFKNILNLLFMRRKIKFYNFITNKFNYVFPKVKNYFKIFHSEFYDEEWYKTTYDIPGNTDPVFHYLMVGYLKGYNPGQDFDSLTYYEIHKDVAQKELNPLIHYEIYGRKENRKLHFENDKTEEYYFILNSPYFDEDWYEKEYEISNHYLNPANHYLKIGFKKGYNPGPNFDNEEYYQCNPDVKEVGMNPLLHYEQYGRDENREIHFSD